MFDLAESSLLEVELGVYFLLYSIGWMLHERVPARQQQDALVLEVVIQQVLVVPRHSDLPLLYLANEALFIFLGDPGNVALSAGVLKTNDVSRLGPESLKHMLDYLVEFLQVFDLVLDVVVGVVSAAVLLPERLSNPLQQVVDEHKRQVGHRYICPIEAIDAVHSEHALLHFLYI